MTRFLSAIDKLSRRSGEITGYLVFALTGVMVYVVVLRYVFHHPPIWSFDIPIFIFGTYFLLGGAYCLAVDGHIRMEAFTGRLPPRGKRVSEAVAFLIIIVVCVILVWVGAQSAWKSTLILEHSSQQSAFDPPIWWYKWILPLGAALLGLQALRGLLIAAIGIKRET